MKHKHKHKRAIQVQKGVALIQVLLISTIISILGISFSYTARYQIQTSNAFEQRVRGSLLLKSAQNRMIYTLLTQDKFNLLGDIFTNGNPWNFYGKPFVLEHDETNKDKFIIKALIQDNNGLLSQQYASSDLWLILLMKVGFTRSEAKQKQGELIDWQDENRDSWITGNIEPEVLENGKKYRNNFIQLPQELDWIISGEPEKLNLLKQVSTHRSVDGLNLMNAPKLLLNVFLDEDVASQVIELRENNELTARKMMGMLGEQYDDETFTFSRSDKLLITIQVTNNEVQLQETIEIALNPYGRVVLQIIDRY